MSDALAELPKLDHVITDASELTQRIAEWKSKGFHVLSPAHQMSAFPQNYGVIATGMFINTTESAKECYADGTLVRKSDRALSRTGIKKIEQLAGISWLPSASRRTDDRRILHFWEYESWCGLLGYDGQPRTQKGTAEIDLRDGSAQIGGWTEAKWAAVVGTQDPKINGWTEKRVLQARQFGLRLAEAKSESAAVRAALGLKSAYVHEELKLPFIVLKVTYLPDYSDPDVRHLLADRATQGIATMYAGSNVTPFRRELPAASPSAIDEIEGVLVPPREEEPVPVANQPAAQAPAPAASVATAPAPQPKPGPSTERIREAVQQSQERPNAPVPAPKPAQLPVGAVHVKEFDEKNLPKRNNAGTFTKAFATLSDGRAVVTVYGPFRDKLRAAFEQGTALLVTDKPSDYVRQGAEPEREVSRIDDIGAPQDVPLPGVDPKQPIKL